MSSLTRLKLLLVMVAGLSAVICAFGRASSAEFVQAAPRVAVIAATNPCLNATRVGFLLGYNWQMSSPAFDFNDRILATVRGAAKRDIKVMDGRELGFVVSSLGLPRLKVWEEHYRPQLAELAARWRVDTILVIHGTDTIDWMGHTGTSVDGLGLFQGGRRREAYAVLALSIYDAAGKRYLNAEVARKGRELPPMEWRKNWSDYTSQEQTLLLQSVHAAVEDGVLALLGRVAISPAVDEKRSLKTVFAGDPGKSWVPTGNEIPVPPGLSPDVVAAAVLGAFRTRGWQIASSSSDRVVGIITAKKKEAIETAVINGATITLTAEQFELQTDGARTPISPHERWHRNLKETIVTELLKFVPEPAATL